MKKFNVPVLCAVSIPYLAKRISDSRLNKKQRKTLNVLLDGACYYGFKVRDRYDDDSPAFGGLYKVEYEEGVNLIVSRNLTDESLRSLAYDLSAVAYHEAHRNKTKKPSSLRSIRNLLAT